MLVRRDWRRRRRWGRFSPGCDCCAVMAPCPPCPGGLPARLYLTMTGACDASAPLDYDAGGNTWRSGVAPSIAACGCCLAMIMGCQADPSGMTVTVYFYDPSLGCPPAGGVNICYYATSGLVAPAGLNCAGPVIATAAATITTYPGPVCHCNDALIGAAVTLTLST